MKFNTGPHIISGIHNYCDRWCERCRFTARCAIFEGDHSEGKEDFLEKLAEAFSFIRETLDEVLAKHGISMPNEAELKEVGKMIEEQNKKREKLPLSKISMKYALDSHKWNKVNEQSFKIFGDQVIQFVEMGVLKPLEAKDKLHEVSECLEVISWYSSLIAAKFNRALSSKQMEDEDEEEENYPRDSDGSAKVALISCELSLSAWSKLYEMIPELSDEIIPLMAMLQQCMRLGEENFPKARLFIRPGFDEKIA